MDKIYLNGSPLSNLYNVFRDFAAKQIAREMRHLGGNAWASDGEVYTLAWVEPEPIKIGTCGKSPLQNINDTFQRIGRLEKEHDKRIADALSHVSSLILGVPSSPNFKKSALSVSILEALG